MPKGIVLREPVLEIELWWGIDVAQVGSRRTEVTGVDSVFFAAVLVGMKRDQR